MKATLKRTWEMLDGSKPPAEAKVEVEPGTYELERIPNPHGHDAPWLVLKGTTTGMAEGAWRQWTTGELIDNPGHPNHGKPVNWGSWEIVIEE